MSCKSEVAHGHLFAAHGKARVLVADGRLNVARHRTQQYAPAD
jgi:hypothetical protein